MLPKIHQKAWISGLPDLVREGGVPLEVLPIPSPKPEARSLNLTLFASEDLISRLQSLSKNRIKLPKLGLVVRTNAEKQLDNQLMMAGVMISSVMPNKETPEAQTITVAFESISARMGISMNPGPPANCPTIQPKGVNTGWIFGLPDENVKNGKPIKVVDFVPPDFNRRLSVKLETSSSELERLLENSPYSRELILVLPDRFRERYVEFKVWNANVTLFSDSKEIMFESDMIECLTGEDL